MFHLFSFLFLLIFGLVHRGKHSDGNYKHVCNTTILLFLEKLFIKKLQSHNINSTSTAYQNSKRNIKVNRSLHKPGLSILYCSFNIIFYSYLLFHNGTRICTRPYRHVLLISMHLQISREFDSSL